MEYDEIYKFTKLLENEAENELYDGKIDYKPSYEHLKIKRRRK